MELQPYFHSQTNHKTNKQIKDKQTATDHRFTGKCMLINSTFTLLTH